MATFGLRGQESHSFSSVDHSIIGNDHPTPLQSTESSFSIPAQGNDEDVEPTQAQSQQRQTSFSFDENEHLVAVLTYLGGPPNQPIQDPFDYELRKDQRERKWIIGRGKECNIVVENNQISTKHCTLSWNGRVGQQSEMTLEDTSTNGTQIDNVFLKHGKTILKSGASISLTGSRFIYRDIEGFSARTARTVWAKYDIGVELGRGAFAKVNVGVERETGQEYAIKIIDKKRFWTVGKAIKREVAILNELSQVRHEHIVSLYDCFDEPECLYLVFERLNGGDLLSYILKHGPIPEDRVRWMAAQMCEAVAYIHLKDVAHRDLKPENVLLTEDTEWPKCKIADFGLAKIVDGQTLLTTTCGTPAYLAPEVPLRPDTAQAYDYKVDSWSLGVIFFSMLTRASPFLANYDHNKPENERLEYFRVRVVQWELLTSQRVSKSCVDFIRRLLQNDPVKRSSVESMLDHEWIAQYVPQYSKIFPTPPSDLSPHSSTDRDTLACSQSFEHLNLSDGFTMAIPGLTAIASNTLEPTPPAINVAVPSFSSSDASVTVNMPGAYPRGRNPPVATLPAIAEGNSETLLQETETGATLTHRDYYLVAGSSPLSSLSSEEEEEEEETTGPPGRTNAANRRQPLNPNKKRRVRSPSPDAILPKPKRPTAKGRSKTTTKPTAVRKSTRTRSTKAL